MKSFGVRRSLLALGCSALAVFGGACSGGGESAPTTSPAPTIDPAFASFCDAVVTIGDEMLTLHGDFRSKFRDYYEAALRFNSGYGSESLVVATGRSALDVLDTMKSRAVDLANAAPTYLRGAFLAAVEQQGTSGLEAADAAFATGCATDFEVSRVFGEYATAVQEGKDGQARLNDQKASTTVPPTTVPPTTGTPTTTPGEILPDVDLCEELFEKGSTKQRLCRINYGGSSAPTTLDEFLSVCRDLAETPRQYAICDSYENG